MSVGFRILDRSTRVDAATVERFSTLPVANVSDAMQRMFAGGAHLRPFHRSGVLAGPALTVRTPPGDNLMLHKAIDMALPGDIIVVDAAGVLTNALMGELMLAHAMTRGVAGFVINGAIRDIDGFAQRNLPTYAAGVTHRGPYKNGPGEINPPLALDGMVVHPGDLMLGDADGLICVPYALCDEIYVKAKAKHEAEEAQLVAIDAGENDRRWVDAALEAAGCPIPD